MCIHSPLQRRVTGSAPKETVEFTTARPATETAVMATYPSPRASRTGALDYIAGNAWKSKQCVGDFETRPARPNPRCSASLLHDNRPCK